MLIGDIFIRGDEVILKDVDGSEVTLLAEDAFSIFSWVRAHPSEIIEAMRRSDNKARTYSDEKMNKNSQGDEHV